MMSSYAFQFVSPKRVLKKINASDLMAEDVQRRKKRERGSSLHSVTLQLPEVCACGARLRV